MRENTNPRCRNGTYPLRGGNDNCTMYTAIQCESICIFNFTVTVLPRYSIDPPILIKSGQEIKNQNITNGKISYFFTPYMRNTLTDATLVMSKSYNDSYIIARLISNAYVPFTQWNYPTTTSFDIISRNPLSAFEIIDVTRAQF